MLTFNHFNFNVSDLDKAIKFYKDALGLEPVRRKEAEDGSFVIVFLGDGKTDFRLELTWLRDHPQKYDLGECEFHLALRADDYDAAHAKHEEMGCICFENPRMGIYFISDPDGYWIEIIPTRCKQNRTRPPQICGGRAFFADTNAASRGQAVGGR